MSERKNIGGAVIVAPAPETKESRQIKIQRFAYAQRVAGGRYAEPGPALTLESGLPRLLEMLTYKRPAGSSWAR